jgi:hypothetical protein
MPLAPNLTPSTYYFEQIVATPANTNDQQTSINLGLKVLRQIVVLWPPGQNGLIGVAATLDGVWVLPWNQANTFVFDSNNRRTFDVGLLLNHPLVIHTHNGTTQGHQTFVTLVYADPELAGDIPVTGGLPLLLP